MACNILLVWNRMGDYHRARWYQLKEEWTEGDVFAADLGATDGLYGWTSTAESNFVCLSKSALDECDLMNRFKTFRLTIRKKDIQIVCIPGYGRKEYIFFLIWCRLKGIRVVMFAESWYKSNWLIDFIKSTFLSLVCSRFLVSGIRAERHFTKRLGVPKAQIRRGYSVVDNNHFEKYSRSFTSKVLLCVARFSEEKNHRSLFEAFLKSELSKVWKLRCVGAGPLMEELKMMSRGHSNIEILSWLPYEELPRIYAAASAFVLPSKFEPWGLVVNEAMAAGLPIIVSTSCGCSDDLVCQKNGWIFNDQAELIDILNKISSVDVETLSNMGSYSMEVIKTFSVGNWCSNLKSLL